MEGRVASLPFSNTQLQQSLVPEYNLYAFSTCSTKPHDQQDNIVRANDY